MNRLKEYTIKIEQKSSFAKGIPFDYFLREDICYGSYTGLHLTNKKIDQHSLILYDTKHIGRGIKVNFSSDESSFISFTLQLPTCSSEISLFIQNCLYFQKYWTSSVTLNDKHLTSSNIQEMEDYLQLENTRIIKDMVNDCIKDKSKIILLSCAKHLLFFGNFEANTFYPVTRSDSFGKWLHIQQEKKVYIPDLMKREQSDGSILYYLVLPLGIPCLLPKDKERYVSKYHELQVCFYDEGKELVFIPYELLINDLSVMKSKQYDSYQIWVDYFDYHDVQKYI